MSKAKVELAPQDKIIELRSYVMKVLEAIGHPEAWVSDLSSVWDFSPTGKKKTKIL
jgi:hypothetical protein